MPLKLINFSAKLAIILSLSTLSFAESGDPVAGKQKSATCVACHGNDGNNVIDQFPKIAGQVPGYIANQLAMFKNKQRDNAIMWGMVATLTREDMLDLDAYYSNQEMTVAAIPPDMLEDARAGAAIYRGGIAEFSVPACMGCHGPAGAGITPHYPRLGGQHAAYIEAQLLAYKSATRQHEMMNTIAYPLSAQQIKQLALYISVLRRSSLTDNPNQ